MRIEVTQDSASNKYIATVYNDAGAVVYKSLRSTRNSAVWNANNFIAYNPEAETLAVADAFTPPDPFSRRLTGSDAIEYAEAHGLTLHKHADPIKDARDDVTPDEAREIARDDANLIYLDPFSRKA